MAGMLMRRPRAALPRTGFVKRWFLLPALAPLLWGQPSHAMDFRPTPDAEGFITATGIIGPGDALRLLQTLHGWPDNRPVALMLDSEGGDNVVEADNLAIIVKSHVTAVLVGPGATCTATCVLVLAAARERSSYTSSRIGVRSVGFGRSGATEDGHATMHMVREMARAGVPPSIIGRMVTTPPNTTAWLTAAELRSMGVHILADPVKDPGSALPTAAPLLRQDQEADVVARPPQLTAKVTAEPKRPLR